MYNGIIRFNCNIHILLCVYKRGKNRNHYHTHINIYLYTVDRIQAKGKSCWTIFEWVSWWWSVIQWCVFPNSTQTRWHRFHFRTFFFSLTLLRFLRFFFFILVLFPISILHSYTCSWFQVLHCLRLFFSFILECNCQSVLYFTPSNDGK